MKPNINVVKCGMLVTFNWERLEYLVDECKYSAIWIKSLSSGVDKEDDCFKSDDKGKICISG
jgi:hypothetical protein